MVQRVHVPLLHSNSLPEGLEVGRGQAISNVLTCTFYQTVSRRFLPPRLKFLISLPTPLPTKFGFTVRRLSSPASHLVSATCICGRWLIQLKPLALAQRTSRYSVRACKASTQIALFLAHVFLPHSPAVFFFVRA